MRAVISVERQFFRHTDQSISEERERLLPVTEGRHFVDYVESNYHKEVVRVLQGVAYV